MRLLSALVLATAFLFFCGGPLFAQSRPKPKAPAQAKLSPVPILPVQARITPPQLKRQLTPARHLQLLNGIRAGLQLPPVATPPPSTTRVSVGAAMSPAGARIVQARASFVGGPGRQDPDGYLALRAGQPNGGGDYVEVGFPTQAGKHYVLDCTVRTEGGTRPVNFYPVLGGEVTETATSIDDHVMVVVRAAGDELRRVIQSPSTNWWWSACDISPVG